MEPGSIVADSYESKIVSALRGSVIFIGFCLAFVATACASNQQSNLLDGINTEYTLHELGSMRLEYISECMQKEMESVKANGSDKASESPAQLCSKRANEKYPKPPSIGIEELSKHCMAKHGIPTAQENPDFISTPEQRKGLDECMGRVGRHRPIDFK